MAGLTISASSVFYYVCLIAVVTGIYILEDGETAQHTSPTSLVCPEHCQCTDNDIDLPITCILEQSNLTLSYMLPWRIGNLKITGDKGVLKTGRRYFSVKDLLLRDISLADSIIMFEYLTELDISYIPIQQIAVDDFYSVPNLEKLSLSFNNISFISPGAFNTLHKLWSVNLDGNIIGELKTNVFTNIASLQIISLGGNRLHRIDSNTFSNLPSLSELYLINNNLMQIEYLLDNVTNLQVLDVSDNQLRFISESTTDKLKLIETVKLGQNHLECSCVLEALISAVKEYPEKFTGELTCSGPDNYANVLLTDVDISLLPCEAPSVRANVEEIVARNREDLVHRCNISGTGPLAVYWQTPWGQKYAHESVMNLFPAELAGSISQWKEFDINLQLKSQVFVTKNGDLHIENFRGYFAGNLTCFAVSMLGVDNSTVGVSVVTGITSFYLFSLIIGASCAAVMLIFSCIIGSIRLFVNKCLHGDQCNCCCCHCEDVDKMQPYYYEPKVIEIVYAVSNASSRGDTTDFDPDEPPPDPPVNSPVLHSSPDKCTTPNEETTQPISPHIWEQLDEVRSRLRYGAERKIEKVRSHVRNITDTSSLKIRNMKDAGTIKIQSIKETGSQAASKVKKNMAGGMMQVKYGVQSIKEFCGTGEMGPGTVSMISVSTDIDKNESSQMVKSHTFV